MPGPTPGQPGWYPDGEGHQRWFDGNAWTEHVQPGSADDSTVVVPPSGPGTAELPQAGGYGVVPPPEPAGSQSGQPAFGQPPFGQPPQESGKGLWIALAVLAVLLLIGVMVVGALLLLGGDEGDDQGTDETTTSDTPETSSAPTTDPTTDLPTMPDTPTGFPSDFTDFPSGFPTELLSDLPTDPAEWASWLSDYSDYLDQENP